MAQATPIEVLSSIGAVSATLIAALALARSVANDVRRRGSENGAFEREIIDLSTQTEENRRDIGKHLLECERLRGRQEAQWQATNEALSRLERSIGVLQRSLANLVKDGFPAK